LLDTYLFGQRRGAQSVRVRTSSSTCSARPRQGRESEHKPSACGDEIPPWSALLHGAAILPMAKAHRPCAIGDSCVPGAARLLPSALVPHAVRARFDACARRNVATRRVRPAPRIHFVARVTSGRPLASSANVQDAIGNALDACERSDLFGECVRPAAVVRFGRSDTRCVPIVRRSTAGGDGDGKRHGNDLHELRLNHVDSPGAPFSNRRAASREHADFSQDVAKRGQTGHPSIHPPCLRPARFREDSAMPREAPKIANLFLLWPSLYMKVYRERGQR